MTPTVFVARSHRWLHDKLLELGPPRGGYARLTSDRDTADCILYLEPPWPDPDAPDHLRRFSPRDLGRVIVYSQADCPIPWAPGLYASLPRGRLGPLLRGAFYVLHHHREPGGIAEHLEDARLLEPRHLWSFVGTAGNHSVRRAILALGDRRSLVRDTQRFSDVVRWGWGGKHRTEGLQAFRSYSESIGSSKFVVCPRGVGAGSIRLYEVMQVGRAPVVVSDDWSPPPFVDWETCSIQIAEHQIAELPEILRRREQDATELGRVARRMWERWFAPEQQLSTLLDACAEIHAHTTRRSRFSLALRAATSREAGRRVARRAGAGRLRSLVRQSTAPRT